MAKGNGSRTQILLWAVGALISVAFALISFQWQSATDGIADNEQKIEENQTRIEREVRTLDDSNANRRREVADLESRMLRVERELQILKEEVDRLRAPQRE